MTGQNGEYLGAPYTEVKYPHVVHKIADKLQPSLLNDLQEKRDKRGGGVFNGINMFPGWKGVDDLIFGGGGKVLYDRYGLYDNDNQPNLIVEEGEITDEGTCSCS